jgi:hypothetical protein
MVTPKCLPQHEGAVEIGQHAGLAVELELDQRIDRIRIHGGGVVGVEPLQVGGGAQVGQQQEAVRHVARDNRRHVHAGALQQAGDVDEGRHVFAFGRRIHRDQGLAQLALEGGQDVEPEVAPEAGVGRGGATAVELDQSKRVEPTVELDQARVGGGRYGGS